MIADLIVEAAWKRWVHYFKEYGLNRCHDCLTWVEWKEFYLAGIIR